jgi:ubiquinone/menaquinone biosynthesis C-methylase UbiE
MSSPIVNIKKKELRKFLIQFHQSASHNHRIGILTNLLSRSIDAQFPEAGTIRCLDVGCGDMVLAESIARQLPKSNWKCIDIHPLPKELEANEKWKKYQSFDGRHIPFNDQRFDVVTFCDVLHHAGENTLPLLIEAARTGKIVVIKDHFEQGWYSRKMLQTMDFVGNWAYGINIPKKYFTRNSFSELCRQAGLEILHINNGIPLYEHLPVVRNILSPQWQFIAVLKSQTA